MPRYNHPISLNEEQEEKLRIARAKTTMSIPDILMIGVEDIIKSED